jgi:hypothetical protein
MSRTTRRHEAQGRSAKRGPKNKNDEDFIRHARLKSNKQTRTNERIKLRREYL